MWLFLYEKRSLDYILTLIRNVRCSLQCLLCLFLCVKALNLLHVVSVPLYKVIPTSLRGAFSFMWSKLRYVVQTILWGANVFMRCKLLYVLTSLCANFFMWWTFRRCVDVGSFYIDAHASRSLGPCARELWKRHHSWVSLIQDSRFKFQVSCFTLHGPRFSSESRFNSNTKLIFWFRLESCHILSPSTLHSLDSEYRNSSFCFSYQQ